jgi:CRISPR-associated endonuclease/helicase Cas3
MMSVFDEAEFRSFFARLTGRSPYDYQVEVAGLLAAGEHIILRAPTGAGKTWATLAPFLYLRDRGGPARVLYALPLRTLAQGIYREARERLPEIGLSPDLVTMQTGEQPDDEFLQRGAVIVTTYDQVLSGLLHGPYGLSDRLHNINAAAIAGALMVFDEFHLMEPYRAFLTAVAGLRFYRGLSQSVWMTATATTALETQIREALNARVVPHDEAARTALHQALPSVTTVRRQWRLADAPLTAEAVLAAHDRRSIVIVNTVARAQALFDALDTLRESTGCKFELMLLHSRFFKRDREAKERRLRQLFGPDPGTSAILVATQVVEAGIDITCENLHTELCPMSALIQRAGRCARYAGESGTVHIYPLPEEDRNWLPYGTPQTPDPTMAGTHATLLATETASPAEQMLDPTTAAAWVQAVHYDADAHSIRQANGWTKRLNDALGRIAENVTNAKKVGIADLIREESVDQVRVIVADQGWLPDAPGERESVAISRWSVRAAVLDALKAGSPAGWVYDWTLESPWRAITAEDDLKGTHVICLPPEIARYDPASGLHLGETGSELSPKRVPPRRPGHGSLRMEPWTEHARLVAEEAERRLARDGVDGGLLGRGFLERYGLEPAAVRDAARATALLHDLGKLRSRWQKWAEHVQMDRNPAYHQAQSLAHTDYDPKNPVDRDRERRFRGERPPHAAPGAFCAPVVLWDLLPNVPEAQRGAVLAACVAAILGHHGSWIPSPATGMNLDFDDGLAADWQRTLAAATGRGPNVQTMNRCVMEKDKRTPLEQIVRLVADETAMREWWPLVAYLTRTLRLSDQWATAEGAGHGDQ